MTREEIAALAVEAGFSKYQIGGMFDVYLEQFAELVAYREREARKAAQQETIALREELTKRAMKTENDAYQRGVRDGREASAKLFEDMDYPGVVVATKEHIAAAIRAMSDEPQLSGWQRAVDEEMVFTNLGVANQSDSYEIAKKKLNDLISWHVALNSDPAVNGGYVLVPTLPTRAMLDAAHVDLVRDGEIDTMLKGIWSSMIGSAQC